MVNNDDSVTMRQSIPTLRFEGSFHSVAAGNVCAVAVVMSFVFPVRIVRMLQVPERTAASHHGKLFKVIAGRRRRGGPFQRPGVPRIVARLLSFPQGTKASDDPW